MKIEDLRLTLRKISNRQQEQSTLPYEYQLRVIVQISQKTKSERPCFCQVSTQLQIHRCFVFHF